MSSKIKVTCKLSAEQFKKPFQYGWRREVVYGALQNNVNKSENTEVYYITPAGKRLRTKKDIQLYLEHGLDIDMFTLTRQPLGVDEEIVRIASPKGYRKAVNTMDSISSVLGEQTTLTQAPSIKTIEEASTDYCSNSNDDWSNSSEIHINDSLEKYAQMDVAQLRQLLIEKDHLIEDLQDCLVRNEMEISRLQSKLKTKTDISTDELQNLIRILFPMLTANQIKIMTKQKKRVNWTCDEISIGFALSYFSRRGYTYLIYKLEYPLPAIRTLQLWSQNMNVAPGILKDSLVVLKGLRSTLTEGESQVIVPFDEMKCKSRYEYNKTLDCIMGPHSQMQTAMVRGLFAKFKQPIFVDFDRKMTPDLLILISVELHNIGFNVVGYVGDNGGGNVGLWSDCNVNFENTHIIHPVTGEKIFMFSDAPHLLKLLRNWFIDGGFLLPDGTELNQFRIRQLIGSNTEISPIFKLSLLHLEVQGAERQNVRMASELFSRTVAENLRRHFPNDRVVEKLSNFIELVNNWFDMMNSYSLNGIGFKKPYGLALKEQNAVLDEMYSTIKNMKCFNKNKELQNSLQIFQKGILMSINSVKALRDKMETKFGFKYILTHRCNQDCLENFYSQMRGRNGPSDHPTPVECLYTMKAIVLGKNPGLSVKLHSNTIERDPEEYISATFNRLLSRDNITNGISQQTDEPCNQFDNIEFLAEEFLEDFANDVTDECLENYTNDLADELLDDYTNDVTGKCVDLTIEFMEDYSSDDITDHPTIADVTDVIPDEFLDDLSTEMTINENTTRIRRSTEEGLEYIAGWISWKFKKANPEFSKSTRRESLPSHVTDHTYAKRIGISSSSWVDSISHGGLTKPTKQVLKWVRHLENVFLQVHGDEFNNRTNAKKELIEKMETDCKEVPKQIISLFAKSRIYMRCKYLNKKRVEDALLKKIERRQGTSTKRSGDSLDDSSRSKTKKMKKIVT